MSQLTSLTCPNCGGKLAPSSLAGTVVCLHCGVEHLASGLPAAVEPGPQLPGAISLSLPDGAALPLIARGARLPAEIVQSFSTTRDDQDRLEFTLTYGDSRTAQDNVLIGTFAFNNLAPAPRGVSTVDVLIAVDARLQLTVSAREASSQRVEIVGRADLSGLAPPASRG